MFTNAVNENEAMINGDACDTDHCANDQHRCIEVTAFTKEN